MHFTDAPALDPQDLRDALITKIDSIGTFRTEAAKDAFRTVPRHIFLPGVDLVTAYAPKPVVTKRAADGSAGRSGGARPGPTGENDPARANGLRPRRAGRQVDGPPGRDVGPRRVGEPEVRG
ncbi:hypothetical protein [Streptomyces californicus]|uniref:hypothetical protein n=1 Tax=Streptomyces californicus TaxID=67351 RepID=UPI0037990EDE